jgi:hypothetical protein
MDLYIVKLGRGYKVGVGPVFDWPPPRTAAVVAVYPGLGYLADGIASEFSRTADRTIHVPIAVLMAAIARRLGAWDVDYADGNAERGRARSRSPRDHRRCTHCGNSEDEPEEYETICTPCLRRRDAPR